MNNFSARFTTGSGNTGDVEPIIACSKLWICAENGRKVVGCLAISSKSACRTISRNGLFALSFLVGSEDGLTDIRFKADVIKPGSDGVVISRTSVGYW